MLDYDHPKELITPKAILNECTQLVSFNDAYSSHPLIQRFGSPSQPIYVDDGNVDINGVTYAQPLIVPIYDGQMELVQCAVMQDGQRVAVIPDGLARGFARYGDFDHDKPVIITYSLEAFFKVAQTGYAVVLVVLPTLCNKRMTALKPFDFEQIQFVIQQLS
ncbi:TPA: helicase, partial [Acinetobacter baumannii]|nr:helicase [Acinetobacter baumannii]HBI2577394.1 helicase [Acinetobacter baumannii]